MSTAALEERFVEAVLAGDLETLRALIPGGLDGIVDAPLFELERPAIVVAAERGDLDSIDLLLEAGADIDARSQFWGRSVGVFEVAPEGLREALIERGALPEIVDFVAAIEAKDGGRLEAVLNRSAALVTRIDRPFFPFAQPAIVVAKNEIELVDLLLAHGADIDARSHWGAGGFGVLDGTAPEHAEALIARGASVDVNVAAGLDLIDQLEAMLAADPDAVHHRGGDGQTPLHVVASLAGVDLLVAAGADLEARDLDHDSTPLQHRIGHAAVASRLIEHGAVVDVFCAAALGDRALIEAILEREPDAVHARLHQRPASIEPPPQPSILNWTLGQRRSPHQIAADRGHDEVLELLLARSPLAERFVNACLCDQADLARRLVVNHPGLVDELAPRDRARFVDACWLGLVGAVSLMLELGFDIEQEGFDGRGLDAALLFGRFEIVERLLAAGADIDHRNQHGATALGVCAWASRNFHVPDGDYLGCARLLLAAGATIETWMARAASTELVELLGR